MYLTIPLCSVTLAYPAVAKRCELKYLYIIVLYPGRTRVVTVQGKRVETTIPPELYEWAETDVMTERLLSGNLLGGGGGACCKYLKLRAEAHMTAITAQVQTVNQLWPTLNSLCIIVNFRCRNAKSKLGGFRVQFSLPRPPPWE